MAQVTKKTRILRCFNILRSIDETLDIAYRHQSRLNRLTHKDLVIIQRRLSLIKNRLVK